MDDNTNDNYQNRDAQLIETLESWGADPKEVLEETFLGDLAFYIECLKKFASEYSPQLIRELLGPEQMELAIRTVHTLKGNSDYLGLFPVTDAAVSVLTDLRQLKLEQAIADMTELETNFAALVAIVDGNEDLT